MSHYGGAIEKLIWTFTLLFLACGSAGAQVSNTLCYGGGVGGSAGDATATGFNAFACGYHANAAGNNSTALGTDATATVNATAVGNSAKANADNSVALGNGSVASASNTVSVGSVGNERRLVNVASGINSTDAVNLGQLQDVSSSFQARFNALANDTNSLRIESRQGIAAVAALASTHMPSMPGKTAWAVNTAFFQGETGVGFSLAHRLNFNVPLAITGGYSNGGGRQQVVRVGLAGEF